MSGASTEIDCDGIGLEEISRRRRVPLWVKVVVKFSMLSSEDISFWLMFSETNVVLCFKPSITISNPLFARLRALISSIYSVRLSVKTYLSIITAVPSLFLLKLSIVPINVPQISFSEPMSL